jgi:hypothetical protein
LTRSVHDVSIVVKGAVGGESTDRAGGARRRRSTVAEGARQAILTLCISSELAFDAKFAVTIGFLHTCA